LISRGKSDLVLFACFCSIGSRFMLLPGGSGFAGLSGTLHGGGPMAIEGSLPFRSPVSKLVRFFHRSRDKWKAKCKAAKRENKSLKYRLAKMTESRDRWKAEVRSLRASIEEEKASAEVETKSRGEHGSRGGRRRPARVGVAGAR
jgi:hypothetical protein